MSGNTYARMNRYSSPRRAGTPPPPPDPDDPEDGWCDQCHDDNGDGVCDNCGCDLTSEDGCTCEDEYGYCWCPLDFDGIAMLFMAMMALGYAVIARKRKDESINVSK